MKIRLTKYLLIYHVLLFLVNIWFTGTVCSRVGCTNFEAKLTVDCCICLVHGKRNISFFYVDLICPYFITTPRSQSPQMMSHNVRCFFMLINISLIINLTADAKKNCVKEWNPVQKPGSTKALLQIGRTKALLQIGRKKVLLQIGRA